MECTLYLTDYCNLKCSYCYQGNEKNATFLDKAKLEKSLEFIIKNNVEGEEIYLTFLGGEPLLKKELIYETIDIINKNYKDSRELFKFRITTNCTLLDDTLIKFLKKNDFTIRVSIDGDEETHNLNRVSLDNKNNYKHILSNIIKIQENKLNNNIRMTITKNTVDRMYKNVVYFYNLGFKDYCLGIDNFADWDEESFQVLKEQLDRVSDFYIDKVINNEKLSIDLYDSRFTSIIGEKKNLFCSAGSKEHLTINSNGELYPCSFVCNNEKWKIGSINKGLDINKFKESIKNSLYKGEVCKNCDIKFICGGRKCGFLNYSQTGYLNKSSDNLCKIERITYNSTKSVIKRLYDKNNHKIIDLLNIAKKHDIKISNNFNEIVENLNLGEM